MAKRLHVEDGFVEHSDPPGTASGTPTDTGGNEGSGMSEKAYDPRQDSFNPPADWDANPSFQGDYGRSGNGSATYAGSGDYGSEAGRYSSSPGELGDPEGIDPNHTPDSEDEPDVDSPDQTDEDDGAEPPVNPDQ